MTENLWIQETVISCRDNGDRVTLDESGVYETFTGDPGDLFRSLRGDHGRCTGRVRLERPGHPDKAVGWVFVARRPFDDDPTQSSLIETWVTVHTGPPTVTVQHHYADVLGAPPAESETGDG